MLTQDLLTWLRWIKAHFWFAVVASWRFYQYWPYCCTQLTTDAFWNAGMLSRLLLLGYLHCYHAKLAHKLTSKFDWFMICCCVVYPSLMLLYAWFFTIIYILHAWCKSVLHGLRLFILYTALCLMRRHAICCSVIDAWPCCCWTMLDASACFILVHHICCCVLDAVPCLLLLHALCFFMFHATKCFMLLHTLF